MLLSKAREEGESADYLERDKRGRKDSDSEKTFIFDQHAGSATDGRVGVVRDGIDGALF